MSRRGSLPELLAALDSDQREPLLPVLRALVHGLNNHLATLGMELSSLGALGRGLSAESDPDTIAFSATELLDIEQNLQDLRRELQQIAAALSACVQGS